MGSVISEKEVSASTSRAVKEALKWRRHLGCMVNEEQGSVQQREGTPSRKQGRYVR